MMIVIVKWYIGELASAKLSLVGVLSPGIHLCVTSTLTQFNLYDQHWLIGSLVQYDIPGAYNLSSDRYSSFTGYACDNNFN